MKASYLISLFTGMVLISATVNLVGGVTDIPGNSVLFTVSMSVAGFSACLLFIHGKSFIRFTSADLLMTVSFILFLCTHHPFTSLWNTGCIALFFIYCSIRLMGSRWNYTILYGAILCAVFILVLTGYLQYIGLLSSNSPYFTLTGPYRNPTIYAGILCLLMTIPTIWLLSPTYRQRYPKVCYISFFSIVSGLPLFVATGCRSAWLAYIVAVTFYVLPLYLLSEKSVWKRFRFWIAGTLAVSSMICGLYYFKPDSADGRLFIWKVTSRQMISEKPLAGFGAGGFATHYMHYQAAYLKSEGTAREYFLAGSNHTVYNEPLRLVVEYGLTGLLLYIGFVCIVLKSSKRKNIVTATTRSVLVAALVWSFFAYPDQAFPILFILLLAFAFLSVQAAKGTKEFRLPSLISNYLQVALPVIALILCFKTVGQYRAHHTFYHLLCQSTERQLDTFISGCAPLEVSLWEEPSFWIYYCTALDKKGYDRMLQRAISRWEELYPTPDIYIMKGDLLQRMGKPKEAEAAYWLAHYMVPSRQKARSRLAFLYQEQGRMEEAVALAHEILSEKVKVYGFETYQIHEELKRIFENQ